MWGWAGQAAAEGLQPEGGGQAVWGRQSTSLGLLKPLFCMGYRFFGLNACVYVLYVYIMWV
jgi:hypothetical protein